MSRQALIRKAVHLSWFTILYNLAEGFVAIGFGWSEGSVSLAGFGLDSLIEVASAVLVLWRFRGEAAHGAVLSISREREATFGIGMLFIFLALSTAGASAFQLSKGAHPDTTVPGLLISALSLSFMFYLWRAKRNVGRALQSSTMLKDADCSLACIKLSSILFLGSLLFLAVRSLWWVDAVAGICLSLVIFREGLETVKASRDTNFTGGCACSVEKPNT